MSKGVRWPVVAILGALIALLAPASAPASTYSNTTPISIPAQGPGTPYPSTISVSDLPGAVVRARATLSGLVHTYPYDLDVLLLAPGGGKTVLMSESCGDDTGGPEAATGQSLTFDDAAGSVPPDGAFCPTGSYKPYLDPMFPPEFDPPAPAAPYVASMSALNGSPANGTWQLFVQDNGPGDSGTLSGGWSLDLLTDAKCSGKAATLTGTVAAEELTGTPGPDVILGFGGKDRIKGLGGKDVICGGSGNDNLIGGSGKDKLLGEAGKDRLKGNGGNDTCKGGKGSDDASSCEVERAI